MLFWLKVLISSFVIAGASHLAGRKPLLAGFIVALPILSMLSIAMAYFEHRDMQKIDAFALSIFTAIPLSATFFIPFLLNRWFRMNFHATLMLGLGCVAVSYGIALACLKHHI